MDGTCTRAALIALLATISIAPTTAHAAAAGPARRWPAGGAALLQARQIADSHWGTEPCHGDVDIGWGALPTAQNARSTWTNQ